MISLAKKKLNSIQKSLKKTSKKSADIFLSYCRVNSQDAIDKGTPFKGNDALGWEDPRSLKAFLEKEGYTVWIDYEQVGAKKTLFEDIVEGIRNAKLVVACVSNEYSKSENCLKEFRFASNLKMPVIMCTFGSAEAKCEWRNTELGIISCLMNKEINFQLENPQAFSELLKEIKSNNIQPRIDDASNKKKRDTKKDLVKKEDNSADKMEAYTELVELAQRKFLRQIVGFSDASSSIPFPRLYAIDLSSGKVFFLIKTA